MRRKKTEAISTLDLYDSLLVDAVSAYAVDSTNSMGIIEFVTDIIFNGDASPFSTQIALLKAFYGEPLTEDDLFILYDWAEQDRTTWKDGRSYRNLIIEAGRRGSKSSLVAFIVLYEFYKLLSLKSPAKHYNLLPNAPIAIFVISQSQEQAKETLFAAIAGWAKNSNYFSGLEKAGKIEILTEEIRCKEKNIGVYAKHTRTASLVGYNLKVLVLDEVARFEKDEFGISTADLLWENVGKAVSIFGNEGYKIAISSAWEEGDYIEQLYQLAQQDPKSLAFRLKTWQLNLHPTMTEALIKASDEYIKNPIQAALEYEGIRYKKLGQFFTPEFIDDACRGLSVIDSREIPITIENEAGTRYYTGLEITRLESSPSYSFAHCDYGVKKDGAALAVCSPTLIEDKWGISVDLILFWQPYITQVANKPIRRIVSFDNCETIFLQLSKARRIHTFSFDSFQSENTIQKLHYHGILTKEMSTATQAQNTYYTTTKRIMEQGLLLLPRDSAYTPQMKIDLKNIIELPSGKITHPDTSGKDIPDAITNSVYNCYMHMISTGMLNSSSALISSLNMVQNKNSLQLGHRQQIREHLKHHPSALKKKMLTKST